MKKVELKIRIDETGLDDFRKELYNDILNDENYKVIIENGFSNEEIYNNVTKFSEFLEDLKLSKKIKTYDDCLKMNKFEQLILYRRGALIERQYVPLKPYEDYLKNLRKFVVRDIPEGDENASWMNLTASIKKPVSLLISANKWIYLYGQVRSGRSYAAAAILNRKYINECNSVGFLHCPTRFKELSECYFKDPTYFKELMTEYQNCDFLVFDEFGSEYKNEFIRDSILIPLLKSRVTNKKITSFTSDFKICEIREMYSFKKDNNNFMIEQLMDLLQTNCGKEILTSPLSIY